MLPVELHLPGGCWVAGDGKDGAVRLVFADGVGSGPAGGQYNDSSRLALIGGQHGRDGRGSSLVPLARRLLKIIIQYYLSLSEWYRYNNCN